MKTRNHLVALLLVTSFLVASCETDKEKDKKVQSISLTPTEMAIVIGQESEISFSVEPVDAKYSNIVWLSSDESVVTVSQDGIVKGIAEGSADVTLKIDDAEAKCTIQVGRPAVESVTLDHDQVDIEPGETVLLKAAVSPVEAGEVTISWSISDENIASIDQTGLVTAKAPGRATVIASVGDVKDECVVNVLQVDVPAESVSVSPAELTLSEGETGTLTATVSPENTTDQTVTWRSNDETVATVSDDGTVTAVAKGSVDIIATCGEVEGKCTVTVKELVIRNVGDIIDVDGEPFVVFYVTDEGKHGKAISAYNVPYASGIWSLSTSTTGATSDTDGKANTDKIRAMSDYPDSYPAFKYLDEKYGTDCYFPAEMELAELMKVKNDLDLIFWDYNVMGAWLPSSTELNDSQFRQLRSDYNSGYTPADYNKVDPTSDFRAVYAF